MSTLVLHAPKARDNNPTPNYKSFEHTFASGVGKDYALAGGVLAEIVLGCLVVLLCKDKPMRAEGTLVKLIPTFKAGNGIQRTMYTWKISKWCHTSLRVSTGMALR